MKTFIYTLTDPDTNEVRYVGKSNNPNKRLYDHMKGCHLTVTHKNNWLRSLLKEGKIPILNTIDKVDIDNWEVHEKYWISKLKKEGHNLTNKSKGGNGSTTYKYNDRTIEKMILKHKEFPNYNKCKDKIHIIDKDELYQKYNVENLSLHQCAKYFAISASTIYHNVTEHGFNKPKEQWKDQLSTRPKKPVLQYDKDMNFIKEWESLSSIGFNKANISKCCKGKSRSAYGYIWKYKEDCKS